ncbi:MAG: ribonuclease HII [Candidatus Dormibacteraeota bacterium]|nr:ribonuclease HII [Candidatus Dormibacteraeota bacterium]
MEIPPTDVWLRERAARIHGHMLVAGVDEAGRGPLAGPVVAAAVLLPMGVTIAGINDSKLLTAEQRSELAVKIRAVAIAIGVAEASHEEIDVLNIAVAGRLAMRRAVEALPLEPDYLLIDGFPVPECKLPQEALIKGDRRSASIMAGGIIAKTTRDAAMCVAAETYPGYGFEEHFGYSTPRHAEALRDLGPCPIHRRSFRPVSVAEELLGGRPAEAVERSADIFGRETTE